MVQYALKFISGKYQGGEFPLLPDREIVVGRASDLDMVLVEDMVSRRHAKLATHNGQVVIQDFGSTNGTFVNGEKIKRARLKEGDRILIGTSILKVVLAKGEARADAAEEAKKSLEARGQKQAAEQGRTQMSGSLEEVPVPDLLQLFSTSKRTGILHIRKPASYGKIYLRSGNVFYASIDDAHDLGPMKAFCRLVGWDKGQFEFGRPEEDASFVTELEDPTASLLMEALRQLDELRRVSEGLPAPEETLLVPRPLEPPLSVLKPAELDVFQLILNHGRTKEVFDLSHSTDFETAEALLSLMSQGYAIRGIAGAP